MMNVKKYRAATTREALEQVKMDLGEQAFVLETKHIQSGGFFGFGTAPQIEISAALPAELQKSAPADTKKNAADRNSILKLNLTDDTPAIPSAQKSSEPEEEISQSLNVRASSAQTFEKNAFALREKMNNFNFPEKKIETVELAPEEPKIIHQRKEPVKKLVAAAEVSAGAQTADAALTVSHRDFELLRAELREVKFTLGAFASRHNSQMWNGGSNFEEIDFIFDSPFYEAFMELTATGISNEIAKKVISDIIPQYRDGKISGEHLAQTALFKAISSMIKFERNPLEKDGATTLAVIGSTGVGKTTTIAKLASRVALQERRRVELVTLDTYRIAAVEQLKTYAEIIGAGCHVVRSVFELDAVLRRLPEDANVLIDTTGRSPHDLADQHEVADYLRNRPEIRKCLAIQATSHPLDGFAAAKKFQMYGADCLAITKMDETMRPGAMVDLAVQSSLPLIYMCMGQRVPEDLQAATPGNFVSHIFRETF